MKIQYLRWAETWSNPRRAEAFAEAEESENHASTPSTPTSAGYFGTDQ